MKGFVRLTTFTCGFLVTAAGLSLSLRYGVEITPAIIATQLAALIIGMTTMIRALTED